MARRAMAKQRFNVERTGAGHQFVIPGTEKPISLAGKPRRRGDYGEYRQDESRLG